MQLLSEALERAGRPCQVLALLNDTVGVLAAQRWAGLGFRGWGWALLNDTVGVLAVQRRAGLGFQEWGQGGRGQGGGWRCYHCRHAGSPEVG